MHLRFRRQHGIRMTELPGKREHFDDAAKNKFVDVVSIMLKAQVAASGRTSIDYSDGTVNLRALGYIYGFIDAALRTIGEDMAELSGSVSVTFQVFRRLFPGNEQRYLEALIEALPKDAVLTIAVLHGGQQYLDFNNRQLDVPMGLARIVLGSS